MLNFYNQNKLTIGIKQIDSEICKFCKQLNGFEKLEAVSTLVL